MSELSIEIAELLGWRVECMHYDDGDSYSLYQPDGTLVEWRDGNLPMAGTYSAAEAWKRAPDYETDFNAFLSAIDRKDVLVKFQPDLPITVTLYDTGFSLVMGRSKEFVASATDEGEAQTTVQRAAARVLRDWLVWEPTAYNEQHGDE